MASVSSVGKELLTTHPPINVSVKKRRVISLTLPQPQPALPASTPSTLIQSSTSALPALQNRYSISPLFNASSALQNTPSSTVHTAMLVLMEASGTLLKGSATTVSRDLPLMPRRKLAFALLRLLTRSMAPNALPVLLLSSSTPRATNARAVRTVKSSALRREVASAQKKNLFGIKRSVSHAICPNTSTTKQKHVSPVPKISSTTPTARTVRDVPETSLSLMARHAPLALLINTSTSVLRVVRIVLGVRCITQPKRVVNALERILSSLDHSAFNATCPNFSTWRRNSV